MVWRALSKWKLNPNWVDPTCARTLQKPNESYHESYFNFLMTFSVKRGFHTFWYVIIKNFKFGETNRKCYFKNTFIENFYYFKISLVVIMVLMFQLGFVEELFSHHGYRCYRLPEKEISKRENMRKMAKFRLLIFLLFSLDNSKGQRARSEWPGDFLLLYCLFSSLRRFFDIN